MARKKKTDIPKEFQDVFEDTEKVYRLTFVASVEVREWLRERAFMEDDSINGIVNKIIKEKMQKVR